MQDKKQQLCNALVPVLREVKGLYNLLRLEYRGSQGLVYAVFSTGFQKVINVDGLSDAALIIAILMDVTEVMPEDSFQRFLERQKKRVEELRQKGWDNNEILWQLTGVVSSTAWEDAELSFTASQLSQIFDLVLNQNEKERLHNARQGV